MEFFDIISLIEKLQQHDIPKGHYVLEQEQEIKGFNKIPNFPENLRDAVTREDTINHRETLRRAIEDAIGAYYDELGEIKEGLKKYGIDRLAWYRPFHWKPPPYCTSCLATWISPRI
jgi:hypothetical protein